MTNFLRQVKMFYIYDLELVAHGSVALSSVKKLALDYYFSTGQSSLGGGLNRVVEYSNITPVMIKNL